MIDVLMIVVLIVFNDDIVSVCLCVDVLLMSELERWGLGWGKDTNSTEKTFSRKKHRKKDKRLTDLMC
jgi:hypothetical protein